MIRIIFLYFFLMFSVVLNGQIFNIAISQKLSFHTAVSNINFDASSILGNQAVGISIDGLNYGVLAEKKYMMSELNQMVLFATKKIGKNAISIIQDYNGFSESYNIQISLGFTKMITENTSVGLRFNYQSYHIKGTRFEKSIGGEISLKYKLTKTLQSGFIVINPQSIFYVQKNNFLNNESCFKWGLLYDISKQFYAFFDLIKSENSPLGVIGGCSYNFNKRVDAMYSFSLNEMSNRLCIGFNLNKMKLKLMNSYHPQLGFSPSIMLQSSWK